MARRRILGGLMILAVSSQVINATTLIAYRNSKSVVLAADSQFSSFKTNAEPYSRSKIFPCGEYYVAAAGLYRLSILTQSLSLPEILAHVCQSQQTPVEAMDAITTAFTTDYIKVIDALAFMEPTATRARLAHNTLSEDIILIGSHKGVPFILTRELTPSMQNGKVRVTTNGLTLDQRLAPDAVEHAYGGVSRDARKLVDTEAQNVPSSSLLLTASYLVEYQISQTPEVSGYPIEVVEVTADNRISWLYCDPECRDKQQTPAVRGK